MALRTRTGSRCRGIAYLALLLIVALTGIGLIAASNIWHTASQREREKELLFVGEQLRRGIQQYYEASSGFKRYPPSLEALLVDERSPGIRRYIRRVYLDPMTGNSDWGLELAPEGGIMGVYSLAAGVPLKQSNFPPALKEFEGRQTYRGWIFLYRPLNQ